MNVLNFYSIQIAQFDLGRAYLLCQNTFEILHLLPNIVFVVVKYQKPQCVCNSKSVYFSKTCYIVQLGIVTVGVRYVLSIWKKKFTYINLQY